MLSENKFTLLQQIVQNATPEEIIWTKGYLAGYLDKTTSETTPTIPNAAVKPLIVYGTETGNSKKIASQLLAGFKKNKIQAKAVDVFQFDIAKLEKESLVLFIMSTQGEGEFPQNAVAFYEDLKASNATLNHLSYAVLALGDTSYPLYCNAGILLDEALEEKGAKRLLDLAKADVDYSSTVTNWENHLKLVFQNQVSTETVAKTSTLATSHKKNYTGIISHKVVLNDRESNKKTFHIEITSQEEIAYEPGDSLGIIPKNKAEEIAFILNYFGTEATQEIKIKEQIVSAVQWLSQLNIKGLSKRSLDQIAALFKTTITFEKADLITILQQHPIQKIVTIDALLEILLPIAPRLYSISSSSEAHDGQVHLTVNLNTFKVDGEIKTGLASQYLADYPLETEFEFYIHKNNNFRLPDDKTDIIMIGPGTGIAPFRSFIAQRDATGAEGRNWLFFGEQHFTSDFYYQTEIQDWIGTGVLTKLDTAFSRDQEKKIYVQDRIREKATEFNNWLQNGANLYICGQKNPMSTDVENAIIAVIATERNITNEAAKEILEALETAGKYQKDVY
ncbi:flavodoxin domain-containing protein [Flavobacterium sp. SUN052]|uniref:diflavin oxidoreductase n=1 Tax=Flavobacterium sp. SUN052 TaxID=3002441 RepID=UPI00237EC88E|nr:flavodoxin domain-containing protein [Flavobacterium sp. SUN052]MEC4004565.1 flavodoxin domain-containing protein [Flavobacterium sp. SUN052]